MNRFVEKLTGGIFPVIGTIIGISMLVIMTKRLLSEVTREGWAESHARAATEYSRTSQVPALGELDAVFAVSAAPTAAIQDTPRRSPQP